MMRACVHVGGTNQAGSPTGTKTNNNGMEIPAYLVQVDGYLTTIMHHDGIAT